MTRSKISFGWDLAGYGSSGSAFCRALRSGNHIKATILQTPGICRPRHKIDTEITATVQLEAELIRRCVELGNVLIDVPIHLQSLAKVVDHQSDVAVRQYWELVKRPVDHVFSALEPLASNLGFATARIANILGHLSQTNVVLGTNLHETYPAATLSLIGASKKWSEIDAYKSGRAIFRNGQWSPVESRKERQTSREKENRKNRGLTALAKKLRFKASDNFEMDDDEFDAVLCAITGCLDEHWLASDRLAEHIAATLKQADDSSIANTTPPDGYALLDKYPIDLEVVVDRIDYDSPEQLSLIHISEPTRPY